MGRIKEYDRSKIKRRTRRSVIYIICEGTDTEPLYFKSFRTRYCNVDIVPLTSTDRSADGLVRKIDRTLWDSPYYPDEGDVVWCVFDCDDNTDAMLRNAEDLANREGYRIAFSNPCFEYWYLLHFGMYVGYLADCDAVINQLSKRDRLPKYQKSMEVFTELLPRQGVAIQNAKMRRKNLEKDGVAFMCRNSNPVTNVDELVVFLNEKRKG